MKPVLCNYYVTYRCNSRCIFCDIWKNKKYHEIPDADIFQFKKNLQELRRIGVRFVDFTGGEPLLYNNLVDVLQFARSLGFFTSVTTNGICYSQNAIKLKGLVTFLHFSLDSLNSEKNNRLRGVSGLQKIFQNIDIALSLGERPDILFTITGQNFDELENIGKFCQTKKLMLIVNPAFGYEKIESVDVQILDKINEFQNKPYIYINQAFNRLRQKGGNQIDNPRCRAVSSSIVISPDNKLLLPCFHYAFEQIPIEINISEILKSEKYRRIKREQGKFSFCQGCDINCYFDPSFTHKLDYYTWLSLKAKGRYVFDKYIRSRIF